MLYFYATLLLLSASYFSFLYIQIISTYSTPDKDELNYHAGTAARSSCSNSSVITIQSGVQLCDDKPDEVTACLLILACINPSKELSQVRINVNTTTEQLLQFQNDMKGSLRVEVVSSEYCKTVVTQVPLYCYCMTPWIQGSTSVAIYGSKQKEFNVHNCCKCDNWFHEFCLKASKIALPGRRADYVCEYCRIPDTLTWHHSQFTNTCTADNFITALLLHCQQYPQFISQAFGTSEVENVLKAGITLMLAGKMSEGKTTILSFVKSKLNLNYNGIKYDCYGGEYDKFLCLLKHIWKFIIYQKCTSPHCPYPDEVARCISSHSFSSTESASLPEQLDCLFPKPGHISGYCGAKFKSINSTTTIRTCIE